MTSRYDALKSSNLLRSGRPRPMVEAYDFDAAAAASRLVHGCEVAATSSVIARGDELIKLGKGVFCPTDLNRRTVTDLNPEVQVRLNISDVL